MAQKMEDVRPETFLQGLAQYSYDDMVNLGRFNGTLQGVMMGLSGVGSLAQTAKGRPKSVMDAIIKNASEMNKKVAASQQARVAAAKKSPVAAVVLAKQAARTSMPGANETRAVQQALNTAAQKAVAAKQQEQAAKVLLAQDDKRGAAAKAVNAMTLAREAATIANKAEKTRTTRALDILANTLKAQADFIDSMIQTRVSRKGDTAQTMALAATAQSLREQVKRLQAQSAVVAAQPTVPPNAPTQQRIADLANKFNIRTAAEDKFLLNRAVVSVLADLSENPMAQVKDFGGALSYYGADTAGYVMADMEFGNYGRAMQGLARAVHGLGYFDTTRTLADADATIDAARAVANQTYAEVIVPNAGGLAGVGRLGALGDMVSDHGWCDRNNSNAKQGGFPAAELEKCKRCPVTPPLTTANSFGYGRVVFTGKDECMSPSPESPVGRQARGMTVDWGAVVGGWFAQKPPAATPAPAPTPVPAQTQAPATQVPSYIPSYIAPYVAPVQRAVTSKTGMYVGIGVGVLALGGAAWYFTRK